MYAVGKIFVKYSKGLCILNQNKKHYLLSLGT